MTATLRVVLDQLGTQRDPDLACAEHELSRALVHTAPDGCVVSAIVPTGDEVAATDVVPGLASVTRAPLRRRELAEAWRWGIAMGVAGGMLHSPSLLAPLVRHDRVNEGDQTVVTLWDLRAWEHPELLPSGSAAGQRAMLRRAEKHADAVVVPTHAMAEALADRSRLGRRIRVIAGAAPTGFATPVDAADRRRTLRVPEGALVLDGGAPQEALVAVLASLSGAGIDMPLVVLDASPAQATWLVDTAISFGYPEGALYVHGALPDADRAAIFAGAAAYLAPAPDSAFPWRALDALVLGVPVIAADSPVHREVLLEGGMLVAADAFGHALTDVLASDRARHRLSVLAADRGRAFSWHDAAARVWALHAEL